MTTVVIIVTTVIFFAKMAGQIRADRDARTIRAARLNRQRAHASKIREKA